ncbi:DNA methyltransferase [Gulosibacter molinativorax]|uniref:DNA methyltransferase n=1 Tax=Gulosibacter molinativorax TaxID=256821 RepID=UPI000401D21C|nr:DNA methyltransferase [Gulosibacter molinativorax]QUY61902.1 Putative restriction enzyme [Gulosibacter molinativorax]
MADDAMIIGESWLSEHFFTTDAKSESFKAEVQRRHKRWKSIEDEGHESARSRFKSQRGKLVEGYSTLGQLAADGSASWMQSTDESRVAPKATHDGRVAPKSRIEAPDATQQLDDLLYETLATAIGVNAGFVEQRREGPVRWLHEDGVDTPFLAIIEALPAESVDELLRKVNGTNGAITNGSAGADQHALTEPYIPEDDENHPITAVPRLLSRIFQVNEVPYALVFAGSWLLLTDRERWPEGRYLAIDLQLVVERNDTKQAGELDKAIAAIAVEGFEPAGIENSGTPWWTEVIEASKKHAVGVSEDLREGVRLSIEDIANEVVRRRRDQNLPPLPQDQAQPLAVQALRYLYRILFLLYAEASPELEVLPVGSPEYGEGYSVDRLRDLALVELESTRAREATHVYESLDVLFRLVDQGHGQGSSSSEAYRDATTTEGLTFHSLRADLFRPEAIALISEVGLGDGAMTRILARLLLSKKQKNQDRGFISYADLGINQLGAVYEGLMSYTGFFAEDDLYEVAKNGDSSKGSWVVPVARAGHLSDSDFVMTENELTGAPEKVLHRRGTFVYRLSGRARQQSASYYTPEVLTKFTVSQALAELLDQNDTTTPADEILQLTVCEPALGSGAFAIEATRQLAAEYLKRKQQETGTTIDPERYPQELQRVKAHIALHQVYGVDLNATAVELAEISLWLDTMLKGLDAPWFGLHLRRGNSLIGARRAMYSTDNLKKRGWLKTEPTEISARTLADDLRDDRFATATSGKIFHFLLPAEGWAAAADNKEVKYLSPEGAKALRDWRKTVTKQPTNPQIKQLQNLSLRVERLWQFVVRRLEIAEREARRPIDIFGHDAERDASGSVSREEIERKLADPNGAYQRLRLVMNAWCALWFWPVPIGDRNDVPPTFEQWLDALKDILGVHLEANTRAKDAGQTGFLIGTNWEGLGESEDLDLGYANAMPMDDVLRDHPWLRTARSVADAQGFFHWDLDFASVMANRGGFDLQVGNPPWVRPQTDIEALYAEADPWWQLNPKATQQQKAIHRGDALSLPGMPELVADGLSDVLSTAAFVGSRNEYASLSGMTPDLYRCFMVATWRHSSDPGMTSLIHPDTHFTDAKGGSFRRSVYVRLRRHWQFKNELMLFGEIDDQVVYGIHVYGHTQDVQFRNAVSLYHPESVEGSLIHNGEGDEPGIKNEEGRWDLRPHASRITNVDFDVLSSWRDFLGDLDVPAVETSMVYTVTSSLQGVLEKLVEQPRLGSLGLESSTGWNETTDRQKGRFDVAWGPAASWDDVILQGVHLHVAHPFFKSPNETMKHNQDWTRVDLETLAPDALPVTSYKPYRDAAYDAQYTHWGEKSAREYFRFAWRNMAANTGERTLIGAVVPPGTAHINAVTSIGDPDSNSSSRLIELGGVFSSLISDMQLRLVPKSTITAATVGRLSVPELRALRADLVWRTGRLTALTYEYSELYRECDEPREWAVTPWWEDAKPLEAAFPGRWDDTVPLRLDAERRQALLEIDAIVALSLGITADELCTIYRTQFPVLYGYDKNKYVYDMNGREVPVHLVREWRKRGGDLTPGVLVDVDMTPDELFIENAAGNPTQYELPFRTLDREAEMREAYAYFERKFTENETSDSAGSSLRGSTDEAAQREAVR